MNTAHDNKHDRNQLVYARRRQGLALVQLVGGAMVLLLAGLSALVLQAPLSQASPEAHLLIGLTVMGLGAIGGIGAFRGFYALRAETFIIWRLEQALAATAPEGAQPR